LGVAKGKKGGDVLSCLYKRGRKTSGGGKISAFGDAVGTRGPGRLAGKTGSWVLPVGVALQKGGHQGRRDVTLKARPRSSEATKEGTFAPDC